MVLLGLHHAQGESMTSLLPSSPPTVMVRKVLEVTYAGVTVQTFSGGMGSFARHSWTG